MAMTLDRLIKGGTQAAGGRAMAPFGALPQAMLAQQLQSNPQVSGGLKRAFDRAEQIAGPVPFGSPPENVGLSGPQATFPSGMVSRADEAMSFWGPRNLAEPMQPVFQQPQQDLSASQPAYRPAYQPDTQAPMRPGAPPNLFAGNEAPPSAMDEFRGMQKSDAGLPYQTDPNTGVISIRNTDGTGSGTMDFGSPERNAEMAARLSDGRGTANFIPAADMNRTIDALNQRGGGGQGMSGGTSPEMQAFRQMQMASGPQAPDRVSQLVNQLQRTAPSRFDSVGTMIAKKGARRSIEAALQGAVATRGQDTQADTARAGIQQRAIQAQQGLAQRQAEAQTAQQAAQQRAEADMQKNAQAQAIAEENLRLKGVDINSKDGRRQLQNEIDLNLYKMSLQEFKQKQAGGEAAAGMVRAQQNAPVFGTSEEQERAAEEMARTHSGAYAQSLYKQR